MNKKYQEYKQRKRKQEQMPVWRKDSPYIYEKFAMELQDFGRTGEFPKHGDQDIKYCMELQRERLGLRGLSMEYTFTPRGIFAKAPGYTKGWSDARYESRMDYRTCESKTTYLRGGKQIYNKKKDVLFYQTITDIKDGTILGQELYTCPNCGAISSLDKLADGCPNCNTFFEMSQIYPKVSNYYFVEDSADTEKETKLSLKSVIIPSMIICGILFFVSFTVSPDFKNGVIGAVFSGIMGGIIGGGILGYLIWAISKLTKIFSQAGKSAGMVIGTAGSENRYVTYMQQYSPEFSYEYFKDKVVSLVKMIVYSEDARRLPNYKGPALGNIYYGIVDMSYTGAVGLRQFKEQNGLVYVTADVYMDVTWDSGEKICTGTKAFTVDLYKNVTKPVDMYFSVKQIRCKGCGGSFDATKTANCPYCDNVYDAGDDDWVVTSVKMK